jgi:pimeloyl-ACP methyl ester carboxylesterase
VNGTAGVRRVRVSAGELSVVDIGDPAAPAVLFVHGIPASSFLWRSMLTLMPPAMRAIAPDLMGAGYSDGPPGAPLGIREQARRMAELLDALGLERVAVVGHGEGGGVAQLLALEGRAAALVLIGSVAFDAWPGEPVREIGRMLDAGEPTGAILERAFEVGMGHPARLTSEALAEYLRPYEGERGRPALARAVAAVDGAGLAGREEELAALSIPTLLVWGEEDAFAPPETAERLNDLIERSSLALLPGCGHFLPEDAPHTIGPLVSEYLRGTYAGLPHVHEAGPTHVELGRRPPEG